jgi:hypothetical protein
MDSMPARIITLSDVIIEYIQLGSQQQSAGYQSRIPLKIQSSPWPKKIVTAQVDRL